MLNREQLWGKAARRAQDRARPRAWAAIPAEERKQLIDREYAELTSNTYWRIWIDTYTGTFGQLNRGLVVVDLGAKELEQLEEMSDTERNEFGQRHGVVIDNFVPDKIEHQNCLGHLKDEELMGRWSIQVGKDKGSYRTRYGFPPERRNSAVMHYDSLNSFNGWKKRLVNPEGCIVARYLS